MSTKARAGKIIGLIWVLAFICSIPQYFRYVCTFNIHFIYRFDLYIDLSVENI